MNMKHIFGLAKMLYISIAGLLMATSCENQDISFGDFDYQTVYFANQTFVRTITLGDDTYSTDLDNQHQFEIYATLGGVESNKSDRKIQITVDNSLVEGLKFGNIVDYSGTSSFDNTGKAIEAMPSEYYTLSSNVITIPSGQIMGAIQVQLTDAFFADAKSTDVNYVIPIRMTSATDSILEDKDYVLYAVKFKNKYHGVWLSHGTDEINLNGVTSTETREPEYVEDYDLRYLTTLGLQKSNYQLSTTVTVDTTQYNTEKQVWETTQTTKTLTCDLQLTFDDNDACVITTNTAGCTASGSGQWTHKGAIQAWGDTDRDLLELKYTILYTYTEDGHARYKQITSTDNLIMRDRQSKFQTFTTTE